MMRATSVFLMLILSSLVLTASPAAAQTVTGEVNLVVYRDLDGNGFLDAVDIDFHPNRVIDSTIRPGDFTVFLGQTIMVPYIFQTSVSSYGAWGTTASECELAGNDDSCFRLLFHEQPQITTAHAPGIEYTGSTPDVWEGTLEYQDNPVGATHNRATSFYFKADQLPQELKDGAGPALWGASGVVGDDDIVLVFSENIPETPALDGTQFCFTRDGTPVPGMVLSAIHTGTTPMVVLRLATDLTENDLDLTPSKIAARACGTIDSSVADKEGNTPLTTVGRNLAWNGKDRQVASVTGNEGSKILQVRFTSGIATSDKGQLRASHIHIDTNDGCITGIDQVRHIAGSPWAELVAKESVCKGDLSPGSGAEMFLSGSEITAFGDDRASAKVGADKHPMADKGRPRVTAIETVDRNRNGVLDALKVIFNENIDDVVAKIGTDAARPMWTMRLNLTEVPIRDVITGGEGKSDCKADTDLSDGDQGTNQLPNFANDNIIFLCFQEGRVRSDGSCDRALGLCLHTGVRPAVSYARDTSQPARIQDRATEQNPLGDFLDRVANDEADPLILAACTLDQLGDPAGGNLPNGLIDAYLLVFSEPMDHSTFDEEFWLVEGNHELSAFQSIPGSPHMTLLPFEEDEDRIEDGDTGTTPDLTYTRPVSEDERLEDAHDVALESIVSSSLREIDCAAPYLMRAEAITDDEDDDGTITETGGGGVDDVRIIFSEAVRSGEDYEKLRHLKTGLTTDNFKFHNEDGSGTSGILSVVHDFTAEVAGAAIDPWNGAIVTLTLNDDITSSDKTQDKISTGAITPSGDLSATVHQANTDPFVYLKGAALSSRVLIANPDNHKHFEDTTFDTGKPTTPGALTLVAGDPPNTNVKLQFAASKDPGGIKEYQIVSHTSVLSAKGDCTGSAVKTQSVPGPHSQDGVLTIQATGLQPGTEYWFCVRAVDNETNPSDWRVGDPTKSITTGAAPVVPDNQPPAAVGKVQIVNINANSATLKFTSPTDDSTSVIQLKFSVKVAPATFQSATFAGRSDEMPAGVKKTVTAGAEVSINLNGLSQNTDYFVAVAAVDAQGLAGSASGVETFKTIIDSTPPTQAPTIRWTGQASGVPTQAKNPVFTWDAIIDPESSVAYHWVLNTDATYTISPSDTSGVTELTTAAPTNVAEGSSYFHVAAVSAGGAGPTATWNLVLTGPEAPIDVETMKKTNQQLQGGVSVTTKDGKDTVQWTIPATAAENIRGIQIWCGLGAAFTLVADINAVTNKAVFDGGMYVVDEPCAGGYVVTAYYASDVGKASNLKDILGYEELEPKFVKAEEGGFLSGWVIYVIGGAALLIILAAVAMVMMRRKPQAASDDGWGDVPVDDEWGQEAEGDVPEADESLAFPDDAGDVPQYPGEEQPDADEPGYPDDGGEDLPYQQAAMAPLATPEPADEPTLHHVTCPECSDTFVAEGRKPLRIECPSCGVQGMLS